MKRIVLCADDYGQAEGISQGILSLIQKKRLSATSCLVNTKQWVFHAQRLAPFATQIDIGLHFNLTAGKALSHRYIEVHGEKLMPLNVVLGKAIMGKLDKEAIEAELHAQIDAFIDKMRFLPKFVDGHQHVQQFPIVRDALINVYNERLRLENAYIRSVNVRVDPLSWIRSFKQFIIFASGTTALKRLLKQHQIRHNDSFAGIYAFRKASNYENFFQIFLREITDGGLIMCHPGLLSFSEGDSIATARYEEYQYISSAKFVEDCERYRVVIQPFSQF